ncbi:amidohydrolase family protein [Clostridium sp. KNHs214]|uniref:amidohydrolase family protein n=1 Tax=Clostridium sp. KNHs214 TaxID=1540257 RepID=UPI00055351CF|nr:amidohydrolase family protein [Clostridium sp. KNHs214]
MYENKVGTLPDILASAKCNKLHDPIGELPCGGRLILKAGLVVDPKNNLEEVKDVVIYGDKIQSIENDIKPEKGDRVINCEGLIVAPGLVDMHLHLGDLFEVSTEPIKCAVEDGVTIGLSPGAGNTFMAPALLGAEVDRGLPINIGLYLGAVNVLGTMLSVEELIQLFRGELNEEVSIRKMTRNRITNTTAPLTVGIKDHMGHFIMSDENIEKIFEITSKAKLIYMSHTQDPAHAERLVSLSKGRPIHLAHATAAGCGTHMGAAEGMARVIELCKNDHVTGEFVTTMLRAGKGSREGLQLPKESQKLAYDALHEGIVKVLISDGQNEATMKGFGDTRDNIPAIIELSEMGVLTLKDAVACMTCNPAKLIADRTGNPWWEEAIGHIGVGANANITVLDPNDKLATYTIVNGQVVAFENRIVRRSQGAGGWVSKFGMVKRTGVGDLAAFSYIK